MVIPAKLLPRLPPLVRDYLADYGRVEEFYNGDFRDPAAFERQAQGVLSRDIPRRELAAILADQNRSYGCGPETLDRIDRIVRDRAGAVVTGQQVGLFSGPLYTIYKALTAVKLAAELSRRGSGSLVPVFWLASDDHDLAEIDHIILLDKDNRLQDIRCPMPGEEDRIPASNRVLPRDIEDCLRKLEEMTPATEFKSGILGGLSGAYSPGRSTVEAFAGWMTRLFGSRGLIFIDAADPRLKEMGKDIFRREVGEESPSTRRALETSERLRRAGYGTQVPLHEGVLNVFYTDGQRRSIQYRDGTFAIHGQEPEVRKEDLLARAGENPSAFSPNVLLRPIYQDALLPTVAYVGGPAEIAYFAQMKGLYQAFDLPMPVVYPRKSLTIVEKNIGRVLKKYGLEVPDLWTEPDALIARIAAQGVPEPLESALDRARAHLEANFESLKAEALSFEPGLEDSLDLARGKIGRQWAFLEKKVRQAASRRDETARRQVRKAAASLYPTGRLQERVFNIVPYLIKHGASLMDNLDEAVNIDEHDHQVLMI
jgi:bacillithiol biosynthesis cysteine-adding enzyme BshC